MRSFSSLLSALVLSTSLVTAVGCATSGSDEDGYGEATAEATTAGKLALWQSSDSQWRFHLKSGNGSILLTSEGYTSRTGAINGMLSVLENGVDPAMYKVVPAANGYLLHLTAANHELISFSEVYSNKSNATRAIGSCVKAATSYLDKQEANSTGARVEIRRGATGAFSFSFFAQNGESVLASEAYSTVAAAYNGAYAAQVATNYTVKQNAAGGFYFTVAAANGQIVGVSQQYTTKSSAERSVTSMKALMPKVVIL